MGSHRIQIPFCVQPKMDDQQGFFHGGTRREQDGLRRVTRGEAPTLPASPMLRKTRLFERVLWFCGMMVILLLPI